MLRTNIWLQYLKFKGKERMVDNFDSIFLKAKHALVVCYAPWCGHCKKIKPDFEKAATVIKTEKDPQQPPPPPPPEKLWAKEESSVRHLDAYTFRTTLRKIKHALVMFYVPWCCHCKSAKPEFVRAVEQFANELMVAFGAVDCTAHQELCTSYDVRGHPTLKYFNYFDKQVKDYTGGRKEADFVSFIHTQLDHQRQAKAVTSQQAGFGVSVVLVTDEDFMTTIASQKLTFVMFYASCE